MDVRDSKKQKSISVNEAINFLFLWNIYKGQNRLQKRKIYTLVHRIRTMSKLFFLRIILLDHLIVLKFSKHVSDTLLERPCNLDLNYLFYVPTGLFSQC